MKKRVLALVLAGAMALSMAACGSSTSSSSSSSSDSSSSEASDAASDAAVELPSKIDIQVPASAGGGTDVVIRALTSYINSNSDTNMTVTNNTDGSGVVAMETVRNASKADGSELLFFHTSMCIKSSTGVYDYKAAEDFKVIAVGTPSNPGGYVLVVPAESGVTDVAGYIEYCNAGSNKIGIETGGSSHIMCGMMASELGVELKYVDAGADTDKLSSLVGGNIDSCLVNANQAEQYIEAGKVNAIAVFSATDEGGRNTVLPDVPSFIEEGYNLVYGTYMFVLGPSSMSDETAQALRELFVAANDDPETNEILEGTGMGMVFSSYEEGADLIKSQQEALDTACADLGLSK